MKKLIAITAILFSLGVNAQYETTLPLMTGIFQSTYRNLANEPTSRVSIGLPLLSGYHFNFYHSGFKLKDIYYRSGDTAVITPDNLTSKLPKRNILDINNHVDLFHLQINTGKFSFGLNAIEKINIRMMYPGDLFRLVLKGNAQFAGAEADLGGLGLNLLHYRDIGLSGRMNIDKLVVGARVKFLMGLNSVDFEKSELKLKIEEQMYEHTVNADIRVNTNVDALNLSQVADPLAFAKSNLLNMKNRGFGLDLSAAYNITDKLKVGLNIIDIGRITWRDNVTNYVINNKSFSFNGIAFEDYLIKDSLSVDMYTDTLLKLFKPETLHQTYTTALPVQANIYAVYKLNPRHTFTFLVNGDYYKRRLLNSFSLGYHLALGRTVNLALSYSIKGRSFVNAGAGLVFKLGPVQTYVVTDSFNAIFNPLANRSVNVRVGANLVFGKVK